VKFEWDPRKAAANTRKHGVSFEEAATAFKDTLGRASADRLHSEKEQRLILVGMSGRQRLLLVVFTERGDILRIISARQPTKRERDSYERRRQ
jgi:uncharacterized DUF497 family protein